MGVESKPAQNGHIPAEDFDNWRSSMPPEVQQALELYLIELAIENWQARGGRSSTFEEQLEDFLNARDYLFNNFAPKGNGSSSTSGANENH